MEPSQPRSFSRTAKVTAAFVVLGLVALAWSSRNSVVVGDLTFDDERLADFVDTAALNETAPSASSPAVSVTVRPSAQAGNVSAGPANATPSPSSAMPPTTPPTASPTAAMAASRHFPQVCVDRARGHVRPARVFATSGGWSDINSRSAGCESTCTWTTDVSSADAVIWFHSGGHPLPALTPTQTLAVWNREPREFNRLAWSDEIPRIDLAMTYNLDANVPVTYLPENYLEAAYAHPIPTVEDFGKRRTAVWLSSNCKQFSYNRPAVVQLLQQFIEVDCLGACLNNGPKYPGRPWELIAKYKFWLGLEKSIDQEYVTEKFLFPIMHNGVGVYIGSSRAAIYAPSSEAYIDALSFSSVKQLGLHLKAVSNDYDTWVRHFNWRKEPVPQRLRDLVIFGEAGSPVCRLCACLCNASCNVGRNAGHGSQPSVYSSDTVSKSYMS